jgi:hypothetical protein
MVKFGFKVASTLRLRRLFGFLKPTQAKGLAATAFMFFRFHGSRNLKVAFFRFVFWFMHRLKPSVFGECLLHKFFQQLTKFSLKFIFNQVEGEGACGSGFPSHASPLKS